MQTKTSKRVVASLLLVITVLLVTACGGKSYNGYYQGTDEQGQVYHMAIDGDKVKLLQGNQLTEHSCHTEDVKTDNGKKVGTLLYVSGKETEETGTFLSFGENKETKGMYAMLLSRDGGNTLTTVNMQKVDKKESPINNSKGGINLLQISIFVLIGMAVIAYMKNKKEGKADKKEEQ